MSNHVGRFLRRLCPRRPLSTQACPVEPLPSDAISSEASLKAFRSRFCLSWREKDPLSLREFELLFRSFLGHFPRPASSIRKIGVAVSGGPDSLALLALLSQLFGTKRILAFTVNHNIPAVVEEPVEQISRLVGPIGVPHRIITLDWPPDMKVSQDSAPNTIKVSHVQKLCRTKRYEALLAASEEEQVDLLLTAHHLDDNLVTHFFRLSRHSGIDGLAAIRPLSALPHTLPEAQSPLLGRPLLQIPKARLVDTCESLRLAFLSDPSNETPRNPLPSMGILRNCVRDSLLAIQKANPDNPALSTERLASLLLRVQRHREEARLQARYVLERSGFLGKGDLGGAQSLLMFPTSPASPTDRLKSGRYWFWWRNPFLVNRLFAALIEWVSGEKLQSSQTTLLQFSSLVSASAASRRFRWNALERLNERIGEIRSMLLGMPPPEPPSAGTPEPPSPVLTRRPLLDSAGHAVHSQSTYLGHGNLRRLSRLKNFSIGKVIFVPVSSAELSAKLSFSQSASRELEIGSAMAFYRAPPPSVSVARFVLDVEMVPGVAYLWDGRIWLSMGALSSVSKRVILPEFTQIVSSRSPSMLGSEDALASQKIGSGLLPRLRGAVGPSATRPLAYALDPLAGPGPSSPSPSSFRISMLTIESLKYWAHHAKRTGACDMLSKMEAARQASSAHFLFHHPLLVDHHKGRMAIPTLGIYVSARTGHWAPEDLLIRSCEAGSPHYYNRILLPSFVPPLSVPTA